MRSFIQKHLDPATRVGECLFGLIMALGITGAVRLGAAEITSRELLVAVLGCNLAWGVVDGVMYVMLAIFERGRRTRIAKCIVSAPNDDAAIAYIHAELGDRLEPLTSVEERAQLYRWVLELTRRANLDPPRIQREDILGGIAVGAMVLLATFPIVVPFLFLSNAGFAVRCSNFIALSMLFWLGAWWGHVVGASPYRISAGVTGVGLLMVLITIVLGG
jgi:hypothetical protein